MSFQEKRSLVNLVGTILVSVLYALYMWQRMPQGDPYSVEFFRFWGWFFLILIPATIVVKILIHILFVILNTIATRILESERTDERDELIDLKSARLSLFIFATGFIVAMATLAFDQSPVIMFVTLFLTGLASNVAGDIAQFVYYRQGV